MSAPEPSQPTDAQTPAAPPTALTIAGSDSGGGAGLQADLKTFLGCGVHGMSAITAVTAQNSLAVSGVHELPAPFVVQQIESVATDIGVGATKTGMLASAAIVAAVAESAGRFSLGPLVVDPVVASQHGDPLLAPDALDALRDSLFPRATLVTPNLHEVRHLVGVEVHDRDGALRAARELHALGPHYVLVKGGHGSGPDSIDLLFDGTSVLELSTARRPTRHTHGTGDTLAAATAAGLARGLDLVPALRAAKEYVTQAIDHAFPLGAGRGPLGHFWRLRA